MKSKAKKILSLLLTLAMVLSMLPVSAFAAGETADHVVINQAYGGGGNSGAEYKNDFVELYNPTDADVSLDGWSVQYAAKTGTFNNVTTLSGTIKAGGFYLIQMAAGSGGTKDLPTPDATGTAAMAGKEFKVALVNGTVAVSGKDDAAVVDFLGVGAANEYEGTASAPKISNTTAACRKTDGVDTDDNAADFTAAAPNPRNTAYGVGGENPDPNPNPNPDPEPTPTVVDISAALAGETGAEFTVKGVVTLVDGSNLYLQDSTGAICARMASAPADVSLGDTVIATGSRADYNGLPQLGSGTYEKSSGLTLSAKETTIGALTTADICTYVKLSDVEVTEVFDNNGAYSTPNIKVTDGTNTIQLYKAVVGKTDGAWDIKVGDVLTVSAAVSVYNTTLQLRNTLASEIVVKQEGQPPVDPEPSATDYVLASAIAEGDKVVMHNAGSGTLVSSTASGYKLTGVAATPANSVITTEDATVVWTVGRDAASGNYTFTQDNMVLGMVKSGNYVNLSTNAGDGNTELVLEASATANVFYLKNANMPAGSFGPYYLEYYSGYTAYSSNSPSDGQFGISFYKLGGTPPTQPEPDPDPEPEIPTGTTAELVTDAVDLNVGDEIVLVAPGKAAIMGPSAGNYYASVTEGVSLSADMKTVYFDEDTAQTVILGAGNTSGTWSFDASGVYMAAVAGSSNHLKNETALSDRSSWTIEIAEDGNATIKSKATDTDRIWIRYNASSPRFSCYKSGQADVAIYRVKEAGAISDGDQVVIYNPANMMALSTTYSGFYNNGVAVTEANGKLSGFTAAEVWTVGINDDGSYTFSTAEGKKLSMGASYSSMPLDDINTAWEVTEAATADCVYIKNIARGSYIEWYAEKNNWSSYYKISNEALFAQKFYVVDELPGEGEAGLPAEGDEVVLYNLSAEGVLASENDTQSINNASAEIVDGKAVPANGGVVFTVSRNGDYYRFYNETYGYLCSNGTGNNAFYSLEASEDADWTLLDGKKGGYNLESRTAKFNGQYSQYLEYYADSYKTYSMYNVTDYDIYEFVFYPVADDVALTGGIVNEPTVTFNAPEANKGADYTFTVTVDAVFGVDGELTVKVNGEEVAAASDGTYTVPAEKVTGETLTITVTGVDTKGVAISGSTVVTVKDEPGISDVRPAAGSQTGDDLQPVISAAVTNIGENAEVTMSINGENVEVSVIDGRVTYIPDSDLPAGRTTVTVAVVRADGKSVTKSWSFTVGEAAFQLYFGQLHSHTTYSDGSGSLESALDYIGDLPESAKVDFVAFTDHSNYFDKSGDANPEAALYDMTLATAYSQDLWNAYKGAIATFNASQNDVIALGGFEMTWSGGPGHINTFNTPGIVSRNNTTLNNKTADAGMKDYYALLSDPAGADSLSQFNHPGSTFGTFSDFAYWDALIDTRIQMVEVGNGEGQIGAGGYYPSYEYYTMALDKGWHVAPTNNQDNHKGKWGNANDARNVILTDDFSEEGIYQAIRDMRVYSTEDKNLEIGYTVNGMLLGSIIQEVPEKLNLEVTVYDPDRNDSISKVEVIVNSGKVAYTWDDPAELAVGELTAQLDPTYSYYYIRVTEGDGDLAVTAPVWVGESLKLGISSVVCGTATPVTGEELTITTTLFNSESSPARVVSLTYTNGDEVLGTDTTGYTMPDSGTLVVNFGYTPDKAKLMDVTVTAVVELNSEQYTFSMDVELDVQDADKLVYIGIDASHYNEYVNGNYKDSMGNFGNLAAEYGVRTVQLNTSADLIAACGNDKYVALILTAPSRRSAEAQAAVPLKVYTAEELAAITAFNANGGTVILAGWSDHYENYPDVASIANMAAEEHMAATQNAVLEALGSSLRIGDDATYDDNFNGGQAYRLYFNTYGESFLTEGVEVDPENPHDRLYTEVFSHYGGASVYTADGTLPASVTPVVFGHSGTYSVDVDKDGLGGESMPKYAYAEGDERLMIMASEQLEGKGLIIVSGAAFMSNFEVQATIEDSGSEKNYSNYKICENLLRYINPVTVTDIADVQAEEDEGVKFTIEGIVTSNASGYDKDTAFFDCIYLQDDTAGINAFPVAGNYKIGDKVRITGTTSSYQGERQIAVTDIELIEEGCSVETKDITSAELNDGSVLGSLVTLSGTVVSYELANGLVQTILVEDENGDIGRIFIDGYITTAKDVEGLEVGCSVTATGLASYDNTFNAPEGPFPRIRIRDRADIVCTAAPEDPEAPVVVPPAPVVRPSKPAGSDEPVVPTLPFSDVASGDRFFEHILYVYENGIMEGVGNNEFAPDSTLTRGMIVTILYRLEKEPDASFQNVFSDVAEGKWYSEAVEWAAASGIVNGYGDGVFGVNDAVTRQQLATILFRYAIFKGLVSVTTEENLLGYADESAIAAYAVSAMNWAVGAGILVDTDNMLLPAQNATRAEVAMAIHLYLEN